MVNKRYFSSKKKGKLNPWFITGYTDGEGSFSIRLRTKSNSPLGFHISVVYSIGAEVNPLNLDLLEQVKVYFGDVGSISKSGNMYYYEISSVKSLVNVRKHFEEFPLIYCLINFLIQFNPITTLWRLKIGAGFTGIGVTALKWVGRYIFGNISNNLVIVLRLVFLNFKMKNENNNYIAYKRYFSTYSKDQLLSVSSNSVNSSDHSLSDLLLGKSELKGSTLSDPEFIE